MKSSRKRGLILVWVLLIALIIGIAFYFQEITGQAVSEGDIIVETQTVQGSSGVTTTVSYRTDDEVKQITSPDLTVSYLGNQYLVQAQSISGISEANPILVEEPKQSAAVVNKFVQWDSRISVPPGGSAEEIKISLPPNSKYVRVQGSSPVEVTVKTRKAPGFIEEFFSGRPTSGGAVEASVRNVQSGEYELSFLTNPAYISDEKFETGMKTIYIKNPSKLSYRQVSIFTEIGEIQNPNEVQVKSGDDEIKPVVYDSDDDGSYDSVRFKVDVTNLDEQEFEILSPEINLAQISAGNLASEVISFEDLSSHCKEGLTCGQYGACLFNRKTRDVLQGSVVSEGTKRTTCFSEKPDCPAVVERTESCSIKREVDFIPLQTSEGRAFVVRDKETARKVAQLLIKTTDLGSRSLDITFGNF